MAKTPEYTRRATANYQAKYDLIQVRFPKGTRERIDAIRQEKSINDFIVDLVLDKVGVNQEKSSADLPDFMQG